MGEQPIRIGIVGLGGICRTRHVPGFRRIPNVEIRCVVNRSEESSQKAASEFGIPEVCGSWEELVDRDDLDAVVIGTWPYMHKPVSVAALERGKHVFCQARMAMDYAEAQEMHEAAQRAGRIAALCPVPIGMAYDKTISRLLREGSLGEPRLVRVESISNAFADPAAPMTWRKDHRLSGLNMGTLGMYIEVMHRWFGWTQSVTASSQTFVSYRKDRDGKLVEVKIPDQILCESILEAGFPVQYTFSTALPQETERIHIGGSKAVLDYDVMTGQLLGGNSGSAMEPIAVREEERYDVDRWRVEQDFIDAIRNGTPYHPDFHDGMRYMQVVDAVYASAERGVRIDLTHSA